MKAHGTVMVAGKVGDLDIVCDEVVASVHEKLKKVLDAGEARPVVALRRRDGALVMAEVTYAEVVEQPGGPVLSLDVDVPEVEAAPPAPHVPAVDRAAELLGDDPLGLRGPATGQA